MHHQRALAAFSLHGRPLLGAAAHVHAAGRHTRLYRRVLDVAHEALFLGIRQVDAPALQAGGAAGQGLVFTVSADLYAQVQIVRTCQHLLREGDAFVVDVVVPAPFVAVAVLTLDGHQRVDCVFGMVMQVNDAGVDHALAVDHWRILRSVRQSLTSARNGHDLATSQPDPGIGQHVARIVQCDHLANQNHARVLGPRRLCVSRKRDCC